MIKRLCLILLICTLKAAVAATQLPLMFLSSAGLGAGNIAVEAVLTRGTGTAVDVTISGVQFNLYENTDCTGNPTAGSWNKDVPTPGGQAISLPFATNGDKDSYTVGIDDESFTALVRNFYEGAPPSEGCIDIHTIDIAPQGVSVRNQQAIKQAFQCSQGACSATTLIPTGLTLDFSND